MLCFCKAAIAQDMLKVELVLFMQSALHLKLLEYWFNRESQGKPHEFDHKTS